jgi:hypothetical protein
MEAERLNRWLTLAANLGVIVGIAFLIVELDQTNRIARYTAEVGWRSQAMDINSSRIEYSEIYAKLQTDSAELTPSERAQALMMARQLFNFWINAESAYDLGLISDSSFESTLIDISVVLQEAPGLLPSFAYLLDAYKTDDDTSMVTKHVAAGVRGTDN